MSVLSSAAQQEVEKALVADNVLSAEKFRAVKDEAKRCMSCGAAFCMPESGYLSNDGSAAGCPINISVPDHWSFIDAI